MFGLGRCIGAGGFGAYGYRGVNWVLPSIMGISRLILLIALIYFVYKLINRNMKNANASPSLSPAVEILNERFAKGEINEEEYNAKKKQLQM